MATGFVRRDKGRYAFGLNNLWQAGVPGQITLSSTTAPTSGASGTAVNACDSGTLLTDNNGFLYINVGSSTAPIWQTPGDTVTTGTTGANLTGSGVSILSSAGAYTLPAPVPGAVKTLIMTTAQTSGTVNVTTGTTATVTALSTNSTTLTKFSFGPTAGQALVLEGLTATQWAVRNASLLIAST